MDKVLYSRISENRDRKYLLRTQIIETDKKKLVKKSAVYQEGQNFVNQMFENQKKLVALYNKNNSVHVLECVQKSDSLYFPYVSEKTLETYLDDYLFSDKLSLFIAEIKKFFNALTVSVELVDFEETENFRILFGSHKELKGQKAMPISNIDTLFRNIFRKEENYIMFDIEWTMDFLVPVEYIFYRCIFWYQVEEQRNAYLKDLNLFKLFEFDEHLLTIYSSMEDSFQKTCRGHKIPLWQLHTAIDRMAFTLDEYIHKNQDEYRNQITVYEDYGNGFAEETAVKYGTFPEVGSLFLKIKLHADLKALRIDPGEKSCGITVHYVISKGIQIKRPAFYSNGMEIKNDSFMFSSDDPQFIFSEGINIDGYLELEISRSEINTNYMHTILSVFQDYEDKIKNMQIDFDNTLINRNEDFTKLQSSFENEILALQNVINEKDIQIGEMNTHINNLNNILEAIRNSRWQRLGNKLHLK